MRLSRLPSMLAATVAVVAMLVGSTSRCSGMPTSSTTRVRVLSPTGSAATISNGTLRGRQRRRGGWSVLLWVLTATAADHANITGPWGTAEMTKKGNGAFHYVSAWYDPSTLFPEVVFATYRRQGQERAARDQPRVQAVPRRRRLVLARLLAECAGWRMDAGRQEQDGPVQRVGVQLLVRRDVRSESDTRDGA